MKSDSPSKYRLLNKSQNITLLKRDNKQKKSMSYSIQEFQFNLPAPTYPICVKQVQTMPCKNYSGDLNLDIHFQDCRRQLIKQKIKYRVKQQMWSLLKRNFQKPPLVESTNIFKFVQATNNTKPLVYIRGESFLKVSRESMSSRKQTQLSQSKSRNLSYFKSNISEKQMIGRHKRVWSSSVKMRQKDRMQFQKTHYRVSSSAINIDKFDGYKIEPWKGFQDPEGPMTDN